MKFWEFCWFMDRWLEPIEMCWFERFWIILGPEVFRIRGGFW